MRLHLTIEMLVSAVILLTLEAACKPATADGESAPFLDLGDSFAANIVPGGRRSEGGGSFTPHFKVARNGITRDAMILEAPVTIRTSLRVTGDDAKLECLSTPVFNIGDGMQLEMALTNHDRRRVIFSRYYDPGRKLEDRAWIPLSIPLGFDSASGETQLEIRVSGGPQGDLVADWLSLSMVRIVQESRPR